MLILLAVLVQVLGACRSTGPDGEKEFRRVLPTIAFEMLHDSPDLFILDVRTMDEFKGDVGHLVNSRNIPYSELPLRLAEIELLRGRTFLVFSAGPDDVRGEQAVRFLRGSGWLDAILVEGGIEGWLEAGFGTVAD